MIIGHIDNFDKEKLGLSDLVIKGLDYLKNTDLVNLPLGTYEIDGDNFIVKCKENETKPKELRKPETHEKYIDIQYMITGQEIIGYSLMSDTNEISENLLDTRDCIKYKTVKNEVDLVITPGMFCVFYPWDVHRAMCMVEKPETVKKIVIKIKYPSV